MTNVGATPTPSTAAARSCSAGRCRTSWRRRPSPSPRRGSRRSRDYAQRIADNAKALAEGFLKREATLVTGGTDNHLVLLDVSSFGLTGRQAESALLDAGVVTNRNSIPSDPNGAWYTSGVRIGTPALTTRGFGPDEFDRVAELMIDVFKNTKPNVTTRGRPRRPPTRSPTGSPIAPAPRPRSCSTPTRSIPGLEV